MKKIAVWALAVALLGAMLTGCTGTTVVVGECTCPAGSHDSTTTPQTPPAEGAVKTGLALSTDISGSASANAEGDGKAAFDITIAAVTVDDGGVIRGCVIDSIPATVTFDTTGTITSDLSAAPATKNELGADYGMVAWGGAIAEWNEQAGALAAFAVGKTVEELKSGAIDESGKAPAGSDLAASATIYLGGYVNLIAAAVENAQYLGAEAGDTLRVATLNSLSAGTSATAEADGNAQLDADIAAVTEQEGTVTSCIIDSVQAKVAFDSSGAVTTDLTAPVLSKNELGENYGMVAWGGAIAEWNEQAAAFAQYVTGKNAQQISGIAVSESGKPEDGSDLSASVTIAVGGFQALILKALQK